MSRFQGQSLALAAGCCAALASLCAKLAVAGEGVTNICQTASSTVLNFTHSQPEMHETTVTYWSLEEVGVFCKTVYWYLRICFFILVFVFNANMMTLFVKSLQLCTSSIEATVTNTASNFTFTAIFGWLVFSERLSLLWWLGFSLIIMGLILIHRGSAAQTDEKPKTD